MAGWTPEEIWATVRRARLIRVLVVYLGASFAVTEAVDIFTQQGGLPDWVTPAAIVLLLLGLPIIVATALVQSAPSPSAESAPAAVGTTPIEEFARAEVGATPEPAASAADVAAVAKHWLTWRKAILGGVLAFALLGVATTGYMAMRVLGIGPVGSLVAAGVLDERDRIILADFEDKAGDPSLAEAVTEAFRVDLEQSPLVTVAGPAFVASVLTRMELEGSAGLDLERARELAVREGIKAVIGGEIISVGGGFVLSARLVSAQAGEVLASSRQTADDSTKILPAIDKLSSKLRERIGESLKTIRAGPPLEDVTTSSLVALRNYSQARRAIEAEGEHEKGIALLEEALSIDSTFAMAWRKLGVAYGNLGLEEARRVEALTRAFEHRARLSERERYITDATYYSLITGEREKAITAYRTLLDIYPDEVIALNNLAVLYSALREFGRAEEVALRALALDSSLAYHYTNVTVAQIGLGKFDEAQATTESKVERMSGNPFGYLDLAGVAAARRDFGEAEAHIRQAREIAGASAMWRARTSWALSRVAQTRGRLAEAEGHVRDNMAANAERGLTERYVSSAALIGILEGRFRGRPGRGAREIEAALERYPLDSIAPLDRPYLALAAFYAIAEQPDRAKALLSEYETTIDPVSRRRDELWAHGVRGHIALAEGRTENAIVEMRRFEDGRDGFCGFCALPELGRAYDVAGEADSAIAIYERYLTSPNFWQLVWDAGRLALVYERLGWLYEVHGDAEKAIYYYGKLVELWEDADPELQPRVDAARRAIAALSSDR